MKSRLWLNLGLFAAALLLAGIIFFKPGVQQLPSLQTLTALKADEIHHVLIQRNHGKDLELKKENQQWWMLQPVKMPADSFAVTSLLKLAEISVYSKHELQQLEPETYGLDAPRASITFNNNIKISFGGTEPLHRRRYLSINNSLFTADDLFYYQLASDFSRYLDPQILPNKEKIQRLLLPGLELELQSGSWHRQPEAPELSADADLELIEAWQHAAALKIELDKTEKKPEANVKIFLQGNDSPLLMYYQKEEDQHYLTRLDNRLRYTLPVDIAVKLGLYQDPEAKKPDAVSSQDARAAVN